MAWIGCPKCGASVKDTDDVCKRCGAPISKQAHQAIAAQRATATPVDAERRRAELQRVVIAYSKVGYRIVNQTDVSAQMVRPKEFSFIAAVLSFFLFGIGLLVYLFYYMSKRDTVTFIEVDEYGAVTTTP